MAGRDFDWRDRENTPLVAVVNDAFAKRFFNGSNPVGQSFRIGCSNDGAVGQSAQIVGVVGDTKYFSIRERPTPTIYTPFRQSGVRWMTFAVRTTQDPTALLPSIRGVLEGIDATVPLYDVGTQAEFIARGLTYERTLAIQLVMFGGIALLLSCRGIYGTLAYLVNQRTSEIGIRIAVGCSSVRRCSPCVAGIIPTRRSGRRWWCVRRACANAAGGEHVVRSPTIRSNDFHCCRPLASRDCCSGCIASGATSVAH